MATQRQKQLAKAIANQDPRRPTGSTKLLEKVGYSPKTAGHRQRQIIGADGVKEALKELGFTEETAKSVVIEIIRNRRTKARDRLTAADMIFKASGTYRPPVSKNLNLEINLDAEHKRVLDEIFPDRDDDLA